MYGIIIDFYCIVIDFIFELFCYFLYILSEILNLFDFWKVQIDSEFLQIKCKKIDIRYVYVFINILVFFLKIN